MGFTVQKLSSPPLLIAKMFAPSDEGDALRLFTNINESLEKYENADKLYLLVDISSITFSQEFSIAYLIDTLFKLYAMWYPRKKLRAWIVADNSLIPAIHFLIRGADVPLMVLNDYNQAIQEIDDFLTQVSKRQIG